MTEIKKRVKQYDDAVHDTLVGFQCGKYNTAEAANRLMIIGLDICDDLSIIGGDAVYLLEDRLPGAFDTIGLPVVANNTGEVTWYADK